MYLRGNDVPVNNNNTPSPPRRCVLYLRYRFGCAGFLTSLAHARDRTSSIRML